MTGRVLIVDDEESISRLLARSLQLKGFICDQANRVDEAQEKLLAEKYDILLTDKNMPSEGNRNEGGMDLIRWVREHRPDLAILVMTGFPTVDSAVEALKLGAFDYLIKPLNLAHAVKKVQRLYEYRRFVNPAEVLDMYLSLNRRILEASGGSNQDFENWFKQVQDVLDNMFLMFRATERALLEHRQCLAEIAAYAEQRRDELIANDPARLFLDHIAEAAAHRL